MVSLVFKDIKNIEKIAKEINSNRIVDIIASLK